MGLVFHRGRLPPTRCLSSAFLSFSDTTTLDAHSPLTVRVLTELPVTYEDFPTGPAAVAKHPAGPCASNSHYAMAMAAQIRNPKSETRRKSEIRRPIPPAHPLTQRRKDSQRFAESSLALRFSAFLCSALCPVPESETRSPSLPLINTQLQLGEPRPRCGPTVSTGFFSG